MPRTSAYERDEVEVRTHTHTHIHTKKGRGGERDGDRQSLMWLKKNSCIESERENGRREGHHREGQCCGDRAKRESERVPAVG